MSSHTHGYNEELHDWERISSASNKLNTQDLVAHTKLQTIADNIGSNSTSIMKACTDIADSTSAINLLTDDTGHLQVDINNYPTTQTVDGAVSVSGSVNVDNFPTGFEVSNFPTTQTVDGSVGVSGSVNVDNFPTGFEVSNFPTTQTVDGSVGVSGSVNVDNFPTSFEVSNFPTTQTVDGTVNVNTISGFATQTTLNSMNNKISTGKDDITDGTLIQRVLMYSKDSQDELHPIDSDTNGHLKITLQDIEENITNSINVVPTKEAVIDTTGTTTALQTQMVANSKDGTGGADVLTLTCNGINTTNDFVALHTQTPRQSINDANSSVNAGSYFDVVNVGQAKNFNAFFLTGNSTGLSGSFVLEGSADNTNWIPVYDIYEQSHGGSTVAIFEASNITYGFQYYRVKNNTTSTITLTTGVYNYYN